ncbi:patatin-like phospholipase family protein [Marinomonas epiphytica]
MDKNSALILSGGGARAAYQVGVLSAIGRLTPRNTPLPFDTLCGTSAGALNATMIATNAHNFSKAVSTLSFVWRHLTPDQIFKLGRWPVTISVTKTLLSMFHQQKQQEAISLMDNTPLQELLNGQLDFSKIDQHLQKGYFRSLAITAMNYTSGESTTFFQSSNPHTNWHEERRIGIAKEINIEHLLASSAIPGMFPALKIQNHYFGDGAIRQKSAIDPALRLGANKLFIIGVSANRSPKPWGEQFAEQNIETSPPGIAQILGQLLNSAFVDNLEDDLKHLEARNKMLLDIPECKQHLHPPYVESLIISPSQEINDIAAEHLNTLPKHIRTFLKAAGGTSAQSASTAASYLLFTPEYCRALIELGYQDAMWEKDKILSFFND